MQKRAVRRRKIIFVGWFVFLFGYLSGANTISAQPSFNCAKAISPDEKAICSAPIRSEIDVMVSDAYRNYKPSFRSKRHVGSMFLKDRALCGADRTCIAMVQASAHSSYAYDNKGLKWPWISTYAKSLIGHRAAVLASGSGGLAQRVPEKIGECVRTHIQEVKTRFGEPIDYSNEESGTTISNENGSFQISYDRAGLFEIAAGQDVVICLMSIPQDCPEGDGRGRTYYTFNLATARNGFFRMRSTFVVAHEQQ